MVLERSPLLYQVRLSRGFGSVDDNAIDLRTVFGPPDWDRAEVAEWDKPWPKYEQIELDDPRHPQHWKLPVTLT